MTVPSFPVTIVQVLVTVSVSLLFTVLVSANSEHCQLVHHPVPAFICRSYLKYLSIQLFREYRALLIILCYVSFCYLYTFYQAETMTYHISSLSDSHDSAQACTRSVGDIFFPALSTANSAGGLIDWT